MKKCLCILLLMTLLFSGCGNQNSTNSGNDATDENLEEFMEGDYKLQISYGTVSFGFSDLETERYTYHGEPLKIPLQVTGMDEKVTTEFGLMLLVDGQVQPFQIEQGKTLEKETTMKVFSLDYEETENFDAVFTPINGKAGDTRSVIVIAILKPSYQPEDGSKINYGLYHSLTANMERSIDFTCDTKATSTKPLTNVKVEDIPQEVIDPLEAWGDLSDLDTSVYTRLTDKDGKETPAFNADNGMVRATFQLYGGPEVLYNTTIFLNHKPIKLGDADYISFKSQSGKMCSVTLELDVSDYPEFSTIYAVTMTGGEDYGAQVNVPVKTDSFLVINK